MKHTCKDLFVIGFALFSMFFGAGNVIFPPYLGLSSGADWFTGFLCYYLADIGLALLALLAILRSGSSLAVTHRLGRLPSKVLMTAIVLCIGPLLAIPRTAATVCELSIAPLWSEFHPAVFSALFFLLILALCLRRSSVVEIVGQYLTPVLLIGLLILILMGVFFPLGSVPDAVPSENVPRIGIEAGYQTMDVLAAMLFGIIILDSARERGYRSPAAMFRVVAGGGALAAVALLLVYWGLTYLGVTASALFPLSVSRTQLILSIVERLLGRPGILLFAVVVALACVTTAAALVSAAAVYFSGLAGGWLSYPLATALVCLFSTVVASFGLEQIVSIATPILQIVYPPTLVMIVLTFFDPLVRRDRVFRLAALGALVTSLLTAAADAGLPVTFVQLLPFASYGFGWVAPAVLGGLLGAWQFGKD